MGDRDGAGVGEEDDDDGDEADSRPYPDFSSVFLEIDTNEPLVKFSEPTLIRGIEEAMPENI